MADVDVGVVVRQSEVPLGVAGVVQPPVGDGRARDGCMEHLWPVDDRHRREVAAERPASDCYPAEIEVEERVSSCVEAGHLVLEHDGGDVVPDRPLPGRRPWCAAAVDHHDREALVSEPLALAERALVVHDAGEVWTAVRVHEYGKLAASLLPAGRHDHGDAWLVGLPREQADAWLEQRDLGERLHLVLRLAIGDRGHGERRVHGRGDRHQGGSASCREMPSGNGGQVLGAGRRDPPDLLVARVLRRLHQYVVADVEDGSYLQPGGTETFPVRAECIVTVAHLDGQQAAIGVPAAGSGHDVDPRRVGDGAYRAGAAVVREDRQPGHALLGTVEDATRPADRPRPSARLRRTQLRPGRSTATGSPSRGTTHSETSALAEPADGIAMRDRGRGGVGRVADVPGGDLPPRPCAARAAGCRPETTRTRDCGPAPRPRRSRPDPR